MIYCVIAECTQCSAVAALALFACAMLYSETMLLNEDGGGGLDFHRRDRRYGGIGWNYESRRRIHFYRVFVFEHVMCVIFFGNWLFEMAGTYSDNGTLIFGMKVRICIAELKQSK